MSNQLSASDTIAEAMRTATLEHYEALKLAVAECSRAVIKLRGVTDLLDVIAAVDAYSLAAEMLETEAKDTHAKADAALLAGLLDAGAPAIKANGHTLSTRRNAPGVDILDFTAIPAEFMTVPKPSPDRAKIRAALANNPTAINWAVLATPTTSLVRKATT